MPGNFQHIEENGFKFVFKMDEVDPELLHIFARHLTSIEDALDTYFDSEPTWNAEFRRFENYSDSHGLYWFWIDEKDKVIMVISCFRI